MRPRGYVLARRGARPHSGGELGEYRLGDSNDVSGRTVVALTAPDASEDVHSEVHLAKQPAI